MEHCCAAGAPVSSTYTPRGTREKVGDMDVYVTGSGAAAIVAVYDIFGFAYPQVFQVADRLAAAVGATVAVPDTFRGQPWSLEKFPPQPEDDFMGWLGAAGAYSKVVVDVAAAVELLRGSKYNATGKLGTVGFCWGASVVLEAAAPASGLGVAAAALVHPSLFNRDAELAAAAACPVAVLAAKGDPLESIKAVFDARPDLAPRCVYRRYDGMTHGYMAARGDFAAPEVAAAVGESIELLAGFFKAALA